MAALVKSGVAGDAPVLISVGKIYAPCGQRPVRLADSKNDAHPIQALGYPVKEFIFRSKLQGIKPSAVGL